MSNQYSKGREYFRGDYSKFPSEPCEGICIPLTQNRHALIDSEDFEKLDQWLWSACGGKGELYAKRDGNQRMHRIVFSCDSPMVDHLNGNTLDNRKANLRPCTSRENQQNQVKSAKATSRFKGVSFKTSERKWIAQVKLPSGKRLCKRFSTEEQAANFYDMMAMQWFFAFANTNLVTAGAINNKTERE